MGQGVGAGTAGQSGVGQGADVGTKGRVLMVVLWDRVMVLVLWDRVLMLILKAGR